MLAESVSRQPTQFTLYIDPETPYATIAATNGEFVKIQIDAGTPMFVNCTQIGICELSREQTREFVEEVSRGENLTLLIAELSGIYEKTIDLRGYHKVLADYIEEQRTYETSISSSRK